MTGQVFCPPGQQLFRHYSVITDSLQQACENTLPFCSSLCSEPPRRCRSIKVCTGVQLSNLGSLVWAINVKVDTTTGTTFISTKNTAQVGHIQSVTVRTKHAGELKSLWQEEDSLVDKKIMQKSQDTVFTQNSSPVSYTESFKTDTNTRKVFKVPTQYMWSRKLKP